MTDRSRKYSKKVGSKGRNLCIELVLGILYTTVHIYKSKVQDTMRNIMESSDKPMKT